MIRWFFSRTLREAGTLRNHVRRLLSIQRDLLTPEAFAAVTLALNALQEAIDEKANAGKLRIKTEELHFAAEQWLKRYPHPVWRENIEVLLVTLTILMGIRTFFLQSFKIPTASMQPTLYGVTSVPDFSPIFALINRGWEDQAAIQAAFQKQVQLRATLKIPSLEQRIIDWFHGTSYVHFVAPVDGTVQKVSQPWPPAIFSIFQRIQFAGKWYTLWFPPDYGEVPLQERAGLEAGRVYRQGKDVIRMRVHTGDHLFVDRLTYNFRTPHRGEIIVFQTEGITNLPPTQQTSFYIKRLAGLGGETLSLNQDYEVRNVTPLFDATVPVGNLVVNGHPLSASTPHFENLYSFYDATPGTSNLNYHPNHYYGHALLEYLAPGRSFHVSPGHCFVLGDNTMNSLDSRYWGDFPATNVIGKSFFVYWPITKRFGWGSR